MIELEKLSIDGKVLFSKEYSKLEAKRLLDGYGTYAGTDKAMWRKASKSKK